MLDLFYLSKTLVVLNVFVMKILTATFVVLFLPKLLAN